MKKYKTDKERKEARRTQKIAEYWRNRARYQATAKKYREEHREEKAEADRAWYLANKKHKREYDKAYREKNFERLQVLRDAWRKSPHGMAVRRELGRKRVLRHPGKKKAVQAVNNALRDGRLVKKPCAMCQSTLVQAHHKDYRRKLDVVWLCIPHHRELHNA